MKTTTRKRKVGRPRKSATVKEAVKKTPKKRVHHRELYMATTKKSGAVLNDELIPIFKNKKDAKAIAEKLRGGVVKVHLRWEAATKKY